MVHCKELFEYWKKLKETNVEKAKSFKQFVDANPLFTKEEEKQMVDEILTCPIGEIRKALENQHEEERKRKIVLMENWINNQII